MRFDHKPLIPASRLALVAGLAAAVGCASTPPAALTDAELALRGAAADPQIVEHAPVALHDADLAVQRAQQAWQDDEADNEVEHLAYLANQRIEIARAEAQRQTALAAAEDGSAALAQELEQIRARQTDRGLVLSLDDVLFAVDRAELQPGVMPDLARLAQFLRENPERPVRIEGHTDSTGSSDYNLRLSEARAQAVASALIQQGVPPARVATIGFGESAPVASNAAAAGRQQNRRVEIVVANPPAVGSALPRR